MPQDHTSFPTQTKDMQDIQLEGRGGSEQISHQEHLQQEQVIVRQKKYPPISKPKAAKTKSKAPSNYNFGYFALWWSRMESEGVKEATARKMKTEDSAT